MSNGKRFILAAGAIIVAALWFRAFAVSPYPTSDIIETTVDTEVIDSETIYLEKAQAALNERNEVSKICTTGNGSPVSCAAINEDTMCISVRVGAHSGVRIDCNTGQAIPTDEYGAPGAGGAKYRSPY